MTVDATRLTNGLQRLGPQIAYATRDETVAQMRRHPFVPLDKGELVGSIRGDPVVLIAGTRSTFRVLAPVIQATTTEYGAPPHVIRPRRPGGLLVFYWPKVGATVALRKVNHPGNRPMPWWRDVVTQSFRQALPIAARRVVPQ